MLNSLKNDLIRSTNNQNDDDNDNDNDDFKEPATTITSESGIDDDYESTSSSSSEQCPTKYLPTLEEFYDGQSIFITGGTGFVGKVLIEKLLYEFPTLNKIYIMLRPKSGQLIRRRLEELTECQVFERIRRQYPERLQKLYAVSGDIRYPGLGINPIDLQTIRDNVSIIFHSAATIRFDEPLKYALLINTLGTKRVVQLAKKLKNLRSFVHVSTAYCTVNKQKIDECVYFEPISPDKILEMADWMNDDTMNRLSETLYRGRPCSYHYTKSLAEHLLAEEVANGCFYPSTTTSNTTIDDDDNIESNDIIWRPFPAAIVRPSIITPSLNEPFPGWVDNYNGFTGFLVVSGKGILRSMNVQKEYQCDLIPVDVVINTCILSSWYVAVHHYKHSKFPPTLTTTATTTTTSTTTNNRKCLDNNEIFVVNCVTGSHNPVTWNQLRDISMPLMCRYPSMEMFRVPNVRFHRSKMLNQINVYLEHTIPAFVVDFLFKFMGFTPILDQVYQKVHRVTDALEFFTTNEWTYTGNNMLRLLEAAEDVYRNQRKNDENLYGKKQQKQSTMMMNNVSERFPIDMRKLNWPDYFHDYILGVRRFLLKEDPATIPRAQNQLFLIYTGTMMAKILFTGTVCYQLAYPQSIVRQSLKMLNTKTNNQYLTSNNILSTIQSLFSIPMLSTNK
uniref:Fatty acyl-CoA reductase n=1 Tax=Dermatophagoides pteronyssinus TaxID=6956 RepID=A0A6P6YJH8_DERPT|nr:fatty acyl-CoA reductase 1-like [Dermatophagoides pteronyssinus]